MNFTGLTTAFEAKSQTFCGISALSFSIKCQMKYSTKNYLTLGFRTLGFRTLGFLTLGVLTLGVLTLGLRLRDPYPPRRLNKINEDNYIIGYIQDGLKHKSISL
jgi:hypothetical protein